MSLINKQNTIDMMDLNLIEHLYHSEQGNKVY